MTTKKNLYASITGCSGIITVDVDQDYGQPTASAIIDCTDTSLELGDAVTVDIGYTDNHAQVMTGYVLEKNRTRNAGQLSWSIRARDKLWRAMAYFIASDDQENPLKYNNIPAETLVYNMLTIAGVPGPYNLIEPGFTFAPEEPLEVQLVSAWDMIQRVCDLIAWHCYCDSGGTVYFMDRKPYNDPSDVTIANLTTGNSGNVISVEPFMISSDKIRNKVVVYGYDSVHATAQAESPFLPAGFYKAEVIAAPDLIDNNAMAQLIADYNLNLLNRLEKTTTVTALGNPNVHARKCVNLTESHTGVSGKWFVYSSRHQFRDTYTMTLTLCQRQTS